MAVAPSEPGNSPSSLPGARRRAASAAVAGEILTVLSSTSDLGPACDSICQVLRRFFAADHVILGTIDGELRIRRVLGFSSRVLERWEMPAHVADEDLAAYPPAVNGLPQCFGDIAGLQLNPSTRLLQERGVRALLRASFELADGRTGVVSVGACQPFQFDAEDARLLLDLCRPAGLALERVSQLARLSETTATLEAQTRILAALAPGATVEGVASIYVEEVRRLFGATHAVVTRVDEPGEGLLAISSEHLLAREIGPAASAPLVTAELPAGRPEIVADLAITRSGGEEELAFSRGLRTLLRAPILRSDGSVLGQVCVGAARPFAYHDAHLARLVELSSALGIVAERAELLAEARARADQVRSLTGLLSTMSARAEPREVAAAFAREVRGYLAADGVAIFAFEPETGTRTLIAAEPPDVPVHIAPVAPLETSQTYQGVLASPVVRYDARQADAAPAWLRHACEQHGMQSGLAVRLDTNNEPVGLIAATSHTAGKLGDSAAQVLTEVAAPLAMLLARARLVTSLDQQTRRTNSILGLLRAVGPQGGLEELANPVAVALRAMFSADLCAVTLREGREMRTAAIDCDEANLRGQRGRRGLSTGGAWLSDVRVVRDLQRATGPLDPLAELMRERGYGAWVSVPLGQDPAPACVVTLGSRSPGAFTPRDGRQLAQILRPVEVAIGYFHGKREAAQRERRLESTNRILQRFTRGGSPRELAEAFTRECIGLFDAALAMVFRFEPGAGEAEALGVSSTVIEPGGLPAVFPLHLLRGHGHGAAQPEVIDDIRSDRDHAAMEPAMVERGLFSVLRVPLMVQGDSWGSVVLWARGASRFRREDSDLLSALAGPLAIALEKAMALEALAESELKYRSLVAQAEEMIFLFDIETTFILDANPYTARLLGYTPGELLGMRLADVCTSTDAELRAMLAELLAEGEMHATDRRYRTRDGGLIDVDVVATVVTFGGRRAVLAMARDMSDRKQLQRQLVQAQKMESLGELAGAVAHDFNNLLTTILGFAGILKLTGYLHDEDRENVALIEDAARRGADLTSRLLSFSRGGLVRFGPVDLRTVLNDTLRLAAPTLQARFRVTTSLPPYPVVVDGDDGQIQQAVLNIVLNARDAMPDGGALDIRLAARAGKALLTIRDDGPGMDEETRLRVFEPFFSTKPAGSGTGLGLAITYGIVQGHHGAIAIDSEPGAGTAFTIRLPLSQGPLRADPHPGAPTLLIVDDDELVRRSSRRLLAALGFDCEEASTGDEAIALVAARPGRHAAVLLDLVMPGMGVADTLAGMRAHRPDIPVIICSAYAVEPYLTPVDAASVQAILSKPFTPERLETALAAVGLPTARPVSQFSVA